MCSEEKFEDYTNWRMLQASFASAEDVMLGMGDTRNLDLVHITATCAYIAIMSTKFFSPAPHIAWTLGHSVDMLFSSIGNGTLIISSTTYVQIASDIIPAGW